MHLMSRTRLFELLRDPPVPGAAVPPPPLPETQMRLHLFSARFYDAEAARRFAYTDEEDRPTPMNRELEGAFVNPDEVEVVHGQVRTRLLDFLDTPVADGIVKRMGRDNTLIMVTELAFGGLPYDLTDTRTLTYLGAILVDV